jgi:hypothetical protein
MPLHGCVAAWLRERFQHTGNTMNTMTTFRSAALAAASVVLAASPAHAQIGQPGSKNSSLLFVAVDSEGTPTSVTIDLAFVLTDFATRGDVQGVFDGTYTPGPRGAMLTEGTTATWDFRNNTRTVNGAAVAGDYRWSSQFDIFAANAQAAETRFAVIGASTGDYPEFFLTSGNPTPLQLSQMTPAMQNNLGVIAAFYGKVSNKGTITAGVNSSAPAGPAKGAHAMVDNLSDLQGWPLGGGNLGSTGNWATNLRWSALVAEGTASQMHLLEAGDLQYIDNLGGTFNYSNGVLSWQAAQPIPEPGAWLLAALGAGLLLQWKHRRNATPPASPGEASPPSAHANPGFGGRAFTAAA